MIALNFKFLSAQQLVVGVPVPEAGCLEAHLLPQESVHIVAAGLAGAWCSQLVIYLALLGNQLVINWAYWKVQRCHTVILHFWHKVTQASRGQGEAFGVWFLGILELLDFQLAVLGVWAFGTRALVIPASTVQVAQARGCSPEWFVARRFAPAWFTRALQASKWPLAAARCSQVLPCG